MLKDRFDNFGSYFQLFLVLTLGSTIRADYRSLDMTSVLEISGTEILSELPRRHREKITQALANPLGLDAYVVICGFAKEKHRIRSSYHHQQRDFEEQKQLWFPVNFCA